MRKIELPSRFWRVGLIMFLVIVGGLSLLPYLLSTGASEAAPEQPFSDSRFLDVEGTRLHFRVNHARPEDGGAIRGRVLLVHGLAGSTYSWREVVQPLSEAGYQVVTLDLPPFGFSEPRIPGRDAPETASLVWSFLDQINDRDAWHLVGHSMGAGVVAGMAVERPAQTDRVVMVSGSVDTAAEGGSGIGGLVMRYPPMQRWLTVIGASRLLNEEGMGRALTSAYGRDAEREEIRAYLAPLQVRGTPEAVLRFLHQGRDSVSPEALSSADLSLIWGGRDEWVPISHGRRLSEAAGAELHLIDEAAHNPMETHPEAFLPILLETLSSTR